MYYANSLLNNIKRKIPAFLIALGIVVFFMAHADAGAMSPLPTDQAFQLKTEVKNGQTLALSWQLAPQYYLYRDHIHVHVLNNPNASIGPLQFPPSKSKFFETVGTFAIYEKSVTVTAPISTNRSSLKIQVEYQGCSEGGFCYPPIYKTVRLSGLTVTETQTVTQTSNEKNDALIHMLTTEEHTIWIVLGFGLLGLLMSFTPCVLPLYPILSVIILGGKTQKSTGRAFALSLSYVMGLATVYAIAGFLFAKLGAFVQIQLQTPWIMGILSAIFIALGFALFDVYSLELPSTWQQRLSTIGQKFANQTVVGVFFMGALATLVLSPCVTPPLVAAFTFIGQTGEVSIGMLALFSLGIGMGLPLLIIGTFGNRLVPKSGPWMLVVKHLLGVMLFAMAIFILHPFISKTVALWLWTIFLVFFGAYFMVKAELNALGRFQKYCGILFFAAALLLDIHGVETLRSQNTLRFINVKTTQDIQRATRNTNTLVMLDFYADWCTSCKVFERTVLERPDVIETLKNTTLLRADVSANSKDDHLLMKKYNVIAPPTLLFFYHGKEMRNSRVVGEIGAEAFKNHVRSLTPGTPQSTLNSPQN